jgi:hypothetical protein
MSGPASIEPRRESLKQLRAKGPHSQAMLMCWLMSAEKKWPGVRRR